MKEPRRIPPWLKILAFIALIIGVIVMIYYLVIWILTPTEADIKELRATATPTYRKPKPTNVTTPTMRPIPTINPNQSFELISLSKDNKYVKAWINIPGVGLDTVVMQAEDNEFFLNHDVILNENTDGAVFFDYQSDIIFIHDAGHIVIYGYNKIGGRDLSRLERYEFVDYFHNTAKIFLETLYGNYSFVVFSVHKVDDDKYYTKQLESNGKSEFIADCIKNSVFEPKNIPDDDSVIMTFSTDYDEINGNRLLVHAYLEID